MQKPLKKRLSDQLMNIESSMLQPMAFDECHPYMSELFDKDHKMYNIHVLQLFLPFQKKVLDYRLFHKMENIQILN